MLNTEPKKPNQYCWLAAHFIGAIDRKAPVMLYHLRH